ncbi:MAG: DMT family transporter, partial [Planctomycetota bacterium]
MMSLECRSAADQNAGRWPTLGATKRGSPRANDRAASRNDAVDGDSSEPSSGDGAPSLDERSIGDRLDDLAANSDNQAVEGKRRGNRQIATLLASLPLVTVLSTRDAFIRALMAVTLFGSVPACIRWTVNTGMNSYAVGTVRLGIAALAMTAVLAVKGKLHSRALAERPIREWAALAGMGVFFGIHWCLYFLSIELSNSSLGALSFSTYGFQLVLLGWALGLSVVSVWDVLGIVTAATGSVLILPSLDFESRQTSGVLLGVLSGSFYAFLPVLHQKNAHLDGDVRTWAQFAFALPVFLLFLPRASWEGGLQVWIALLYMSLAVTLVGHALWIQASTALSTTTTSVLSYLYVPIAMAAGVIFLGEHLSSRTLVGATCILAGNIATLW